MSKENDSGCWKAVFMKRIADKEKAAEPTLSDLTNRLFNLERLVEQGARVPDDVIYNLQLQVQEKIEEMIDEQRTGTGNFIQHD